MAYGRTGTAEPADSLDQSLTGIIRPCDLDLLTGDREQALSILERLTADAYALNETPTVKGLLTASPQRLTLQELPAYRKVRSIQVNDLGIFSYPYFNCRFRTTGGKLFFEKTTGSQRKSGHIYDNRSGSKVFLGGWSVNNDPQTTYGSENSVAGKVYKIGRDKVVMLFLAGDKRSFELYELKKQPR